MDYKDYYKILGVAKDASAQDIKKAYRRLARKHHPDLSQDKDAAKRMAEINEANAVLSDPEKRAAYDQLGAAPAGGFGGHDGFEPPPHWDEGHTFHASHSGDSEAFSDFFDQLFGQSAHARQARASGRPQADRKGRDQHAVIELDLQDSYQGAQRSLHLRSTSLDAHGHPVEKTRELHVTIPKGVKEGQLIRLAGHGGPGEGHGPAGDLLLEVRFNPDPSWHAEDKDVYQHVAIAPWEAALGGPIQVQTLAGTLEVNVPAGWKKGRKLRLRGKGLPAKSPGDMYLLLDIALPPAPDEASRKAYQAFAEAFPHFDARHAGT
ncbi:DnaJ domain-containing protein [Acidovorax sp. Be4]|uniref:DnaJ domain-containing protein n=1 Tax=Acidovorax bellezanensis TaxID=2976702 RepID=A0ABT2PIF7_9BURK|nr:DnaJ C-terminal domain-containing protein [Acidovorax sp. Be4]MCT9809569.1 DnaJ domain-containing protein [Acidovorax sp. Be4]